MAGKKKALTDAEVTAEVDGLLGEFGVLGEAEGDYRHGALPTVKDGEGRRTAPSAEPDALWGGKKK